MRAGRRLPARVRDPVNRLICGPPEPVPATGRRGRHRPQYEQDEARRRGPRHRRAVACHSDDRARPHRYNTRFEPAPRRPPGRRRDRRGGAGPGTQQRERIDVAPVGDPAGTEMQVRRAPRATRPTDRAEPCSRRHPGTAPHIDRGEVQVAGHEPAARHRDRAARVSDRSREPHPPTAGRPHRRPDRRGEVDAAVLAGCEAIRADGEPADRLTVDRRAPGSRHRRIGDEKDGEQREARQTGHRPTVRRAAPASGRGG